jgi:hypothetical protein
MELHPEYERVKANLEAAGYPLDIEPGVSPHVERVQWVDEDGHVLRVRQRVVASDGVRFLDLEHEVGHVHQLTTRFGDDPPYTKRMVERPGQTPMESEDRRGVLTASQDKVGEFHNRLVEYNRLAERGVSPSILAEHREGVLTWQRKCRNAMRSGTVAQWADERYGDIESLRQRYRELTANLNSDVP